MLLDEMSFIILIGASLITLSILTSVISFRIGAPLLLVFLSVGLLAGEDGLGGIGFNDSRMAYLIGSMALAIVLFDSGFATSLHTFRAATSPSIMLATVGVLITAGLTGAAAHFLLDLPWLQGLLLGAIIASTDAAAVFFLLRVGGITLRERLRATLEIESGMNDPMAAFLTVALVELLVHGGTAAAPLQVLAHFGGQVVIGTAFGVGGGLLMVQAANRIELDQGLFPLLMLSLALTLFAATNIAGGSGLLAVYIAGLVTGNSKLRSTNTLRRFQSGMTWLAQIVMFLTLGLLATPSQFQWVALPAVALALLLTFVARPLAVWLCLMPFGYSRAETAFVGWVGLRGAVSILLAILPVTAGLPRGQEMFNTVFLIVLVSLLLQGWTIRPVARWLGLIVPRRIGPVDRVELDLPDQAEHELVAYTIHPESPVAAGERIPRWARPSLVVRDSHSMLLPLAGRLRPGDTVYIFVLPHRLRLLDRLFAGRTALAEDDHEFFGDFVIEADAPMAHLAALYGVTVRPGDAGLRVHEVMERAFGGHLEIGDRLNYGLFDLVVRSLDEDTHKVSEVGMALDPRPARRQPPVFAINRKLAAFFSRLFRGA